MISQYQGIYPLFLSCSTFVLYQIKASVFYLLSDASNTLPDQSPQRDTESLTRKSLNSCAAIITVMYAIQIFQPIRKWGTSQIENARNNDI